MTQAAIDTAIIGGGLAGLVAGLKRIEDLGRDGPEVTILEAGQRAGGRTLTEARGGFRCEWAAECFHIPEDDPAFQWLLNAVEGLDPVRAHAAARKRSIIKDGRRIALGPGALLTGRLLALKARLRLLLEPFTAGPPAGDESLADFARRRLGPETVANLFAPMSAGIFAGDPERLSLRSAFPRLAALDAAGGLTRAMLVALGGALRRKITKAPRPGPGPRRMLSFRGGLSELIAGLEARLGPALRLGCPTLSVEAEDGGFRLRLGEGEAVRARRLIVAAPADAAARILEELDPELSAELAGIESIDVAVVGLGYRQEQIRRPLEGFGALVGPDRRPQGERLEALGYLCSSTSFPGRAPEGHVLFRILYGGAKAPALATAGSEALLALARRELAAVVGAEGEPVWTAHFEHRRGIPQYQVGHAARLARIDALLERWPGLTLAGNSYRGPGLADTLRSGLRAAEGCRTALAQGAER